MAKAVEEPIGTVVKRFKIRHDPMMSEFCPFVLSSESRDIAHFTTHRRAIDYRDWLIERRKNDEE